MDNKAGTGIQCPKCQDIIFSNFRHDFKYCTCRECYVDGGYDYLRVGFSGAMPKYVERLKAKKKVKKAKQPAKRVKKAK